MKKKATKTKRREVVKRYGVVVDYKEDGRTVDGWYVYDMLFAESASKTFRTNKAAKKVADKLNATVLERGRLYVRLVNGFVAVAHGWNAETGPWMSPIAIPGESPKQYVAREMQLRKLFNKK
jgi:hypothetical protein